MRGRFGLRETSSSHEMIEAFIFAAGASERMGSPKPLLRFGDQTLLERLASAFRNAGSEKMSVLVRREDETLRKEVLRIGATEIINENPEVGMSGSVVLAAESCSCQWVALTPCDLPFITPQVVASCVVGLDKSTPILQPGFNGRRGHPVFLHKSVCVELVHEIRRGRTLREFVRDRNPKVVELASELPLRDINTPGEYGEALSLLGLTV